MKWHPPETAPRGQMILADFGWPWPIPAVFDEYDEQWVVATVQCSPMADGGNNYWLETDTEKPSKLKRWAAMPKLPKTK